MEQTNKSKILIAFEQFNAWFYNNGYQPHKTSLEQIKDHWKIDATIESNGSKRTDTFFMTESKLTKWVGFNKDHELITRVISEHEESRIDRMRKAVERGY